MKSLLLRWLGLGFQEPDLAGPNVLWAGLAKISDLGVDEVSNFSKITGSGVKHFCRIAKLEMEKTFLLLAFRPGSRFSCLSLYLSSIFIQELCVWITIRRIQ